MNKMTINGETFEFENGNVSLKNGKIIVDGKEFKDVGNAHSDIVIYGNVGSITTTNGDIVINGDVNGDITTVNGDIKAHTITGKIKTTNGDVTSTIKQTISDTIKVVKEKFASIKE